MPCLLHYMFISSAQMTISTHSLDVAPPLYSCGPETHMQLSQEAEVSGILMEGLVSFLPLYMEIVTATVTLPKELNISYISLLFIGIQWAHVFCRSL